MPTARWRDPADRALPPHLRLQRQIALPHWSSHSVLRAREPSHDSVEHADGALLGVALLRCGVGQTVQKLGEALPKRALLHDEARRLGARRVSWRLGANSSKRPALDAEVLTLTRLAHVT